jgi:hypothetical protein
MANRVLLGQDGSDYVLKVSKPGVNVLTADDDELIFDSTKPEGSMILASGSTSITFSTLPYVGGWVNFPQTYSFEPVVLLSRDLGSNTVRNMPESELGNEGSGSAKDPASRFTLNARVSVEAQTNRFRIHIGAVGGNTAGARPRLLGGTHTFYYLVLNIGGATSS